MRTIKPIGKGEEIFNDYGQLPRSDLLRRYGYITENYRPYDVAEISTQDLLSTFRSSAALQGLNLKSLSEEELERRVRHL
jgi:N-lysine methyltransferase SETD6